MQLQRKSGVHNLMDLIFISFYIVGTMVIKPISITRWLNDKVGRKELVIRYRNIHLLHNGNVSIMLLLVYRSQGHSNPARVEGWGGSGLAVPQLKNPWGDHLKFKNQCHFQYNNSKSWSIQRLFTIIKLLILIQCFYFTHIIHSS